MEKTEIKEKFTQFLDEWKALFNAFNTSKEENKVEVKEEVKEEKIEEKPIEADFGQIADEIKKSIAGVVEKFTAVDQEFATIKAEIVTAKETIAKQDELIKKTFSLIEKVMELPTAASSQKKKDGVKVTGSGISQAEIDAWINKYSK